MKVPPSIQENAQRLETLLRDNKIAPEVAFELIRQTFGDDAAAAVMEGRAEKDKEAHNTRNSFP